MWADAHTGAGTSTYVVQSVNCLLTNSVLRMEHNFLHNTKITRSKINEDNAFKKSKKRNRTTGRTIGFHEQQHQILGYNDVFTNLRFVEISTRPFEHRSTTKIKLNRKGNLHRPDMTDDSEDVHQSNSEVEFVRRRKFTPASHRLFTANQTLLHHGNVAHSSSFDHVTQFSLRPPEILELFAKLGAYFRWFEIGEVMSLDAIEEGLKTNVVESMWIDGIGRQVKIRKMALKEVREHLAGLEVELAHSVTLKDHLCHVIDNDIDCGLFFHDDKEEKLPIPVFSNVLPDHPNAFLLHLMLTQVSAIILLCWLAIATNSRHVCYNATGTVRDRTRF